jgi:hypothetical protein
MMTDKQKRIGLFLIGCMGVRFLMAWIAKTYTGYLPWMGYIALIPAIGFFLIYALGLRKTGAEVFGDRIWWNSLRPIHGLLYVLFAVLAIQKNTGAWKVLALDASIGLAAFSWHHI